MSDVVMCVLMLYVLRQVPDTSMITLRLAGSSSGSSSKPCANCDISSGVVGVLCHYCQDGVAEGIRGDVSEAGILEMVSQILLISLVTGHLPL